MVIGGALLALLLYLAVPRLTTAYAENAHLKQTLAAKDAELARAHAQISELSTQLGEPAAMGAGRGQPRRRRGRRPRPAAPAMEQPPADEPLGAAVAAPPLAAAANATEVASLLAAAGAITRPACRAAWLREQADEVDRLVEFHIASGCAGIFSPCLSSEMFELTPDERTALAARVHKAAAGRCAVVATPPMPPGVRMP